MVPDFRAYRIGSWPSLGVLLGALMLVGCGGGDRSSLGLLDFPSSGSPKEQGPLAPVNEPLRDGPSIAEDKVPQPVAVGGQTVQAAPEIPREIAPSPPIEPVLVEPVAPDEIRVGLLLPLSGRAARLGEAMFNAASLAMFDISDQRFRLMPRDTGGTVQGAEQAAMSALQDGADLLIGPLFSANAKAVAGLAEARGVNVVSFSNDSTAAGRNVSLLGFLPENQINRVIGYALADGKNRIAILAPDTANGRRLAQIGAETVLRGGGEVTRTNFFAGDLSDLGEVVRDFADYDLRREALEVERAALESQGNAAARRALNRLEGLDTIGDPPYDAVFMPVPAGQVREVATRLAYFDVEAKTVKLLGLEDWGGEQSLLAEPSLSGAWFPATPPEYWDRFKAHYSNAFGTEPPRLASIAYDATAMAALLALEEQGIDPTQLTFSEGFSGADGLFRIGYDGLAERALAILEVRRRGLMIRDPAPQTFAAVPVN